MRIDKYLKLTRVIKRRTIAKEVVDNGRVKINDKIAKPSSEVNVGDILSMRLGKNNIVIKVLISDEKALKKNEIGYELVSQTKDET